MIVAERLFKFKEGKVDYERIVPLKEEETENETNL